MHDPVNIQQGQQAVAAGLISREQAFQCLEEATRRRCSLFQVAVQAGMLRAEDAHRLHRGGASPAPAMTDSARLTGPAPGLTGTSSPGELSDSTRTVTGPNPMLASGSPGPSAGSGVVAAGGPDQADATRTVAGAVNPMLASGPGHASGPAATASSPDGPPAMPPPSLLSGGEVPLPEIGQVLDGYEIIRELGRGGMGAVFVARKGGTDYALKAIITSDESALARFEREARACAEVDDHPNIVRIRHYAKHGVLPYLVLDLVDGKGLDDILEPGNPLELDRALELTIKIAGALQHIHDKGVIHRDLKPANILIRGEDGEPMLTDFGLARGKDAEALTRTSDFIGTPNYMSPEQAGSEHDDVGPPTDVFALGVMLYEFTTGHRPFVGDSVMAIIKRIMFEDPQPPSTHVPDMNPDLETVILKSINKDIPDRYENAAALAEDLRRLRAGEPIVGKRLTPWELRRNRILRKYGDRGLKLAKVAAVLVITVTLTAVGVKLWSAPREAATAEYKASGEPLNVAWGRVQSQLPRLLTGALLNRADLDFPPEALAANAATVRAFDEQLKANLDRRAELRGQFVKADWVLDPALNPARLSTMLSIAELLKIAGYDLQSGASREEPVLPDLGVLKLARRVAQSKSEGLRSLEGPAEELASRLSDSARQENDTAPSERKTGAFLLKRTVGLLRETVQLGLEIEREPPQPAPEPADPSATSEEKDKTPKLIVRLENLLDISKPSAVEAAGAEGAPPERTQAGLEEFLLPAIATVRQRQAWKAIDTLLLEGAKQNRWPVDKWSESDALSLWIDVPRDIANLLVPVETFLNRYPTFFRDRDAWRTSREQIRRMITDPRITREAIPACRALALHRALFHLEEGLLDSDGSARNFKDGRRIVRRILPLAPIAQPLHEELSRLQIKLLTKPELVGSMERGDSAATEINLRELGLKRFYEFVFVLNPERDIPQEYGLHRIAEVAGELLLSGQTTLDNDAATKKNNEEAIKRSILSIMRMVCIVSRAGFVPRFIGQELSRFADRLDVMPTLEKELILKGGVTPEFLFWKSFLVRRIKGLDGEEKRKRQKALLIEQLADIKAALADDRLHDNLRGLALVKRWKLVKEARKLGLPDLPENTEIIKDLEAAVETYKHHEPDAVLIELLHVKLAEKAPIDELMTLNRRAETVARRRKELTEITLRSAGRSELFKGRDPHYPLSELMDKRFNQEMAEIQATRGEIFLRMNRYKDAESCASKALEFDDNAAGFYILTRAFLGQGRVDKARGVIALFRQQHPDMSVGDVNDLHVRRMTRMIDEATRRSK